MQGKVIGKFIGLEQGHTFRVWTNSIPSTARKYFHVTEVGKTGCDSESCTHFSHDPSAPLFELEPIWPVVMYSNRLTDRTKETLFYYLRDGEYVLAIEEDLEGRWWDKVFCLTNEDGE